jgi:hypothetical protein
MTSGVDEKMRILGSLLKVLMILSLSLALGSAATARTYHEAHGPQRVFLTDTASGPIFELCLSKKVVDETGKPITPVHINVCGKCTFDALGNLNFRDPKSELLLVLKPPKFVTVLAEDYSPNISIPPASPRAAQAPPSFF